MLSLVLCLPCLRIHYYKAIRVPVPTQSDPSFSSLGPWMGGPGPLTSRRELPLPSPGCQGGRKVGMLVLGAPPGLMAPEGKERAQATSKDATLPGP